MSAPVASLLGSSPSGGRFDFDDGGTYCGGWQDGKAHGHGVCTGPKNVGEYSGSWNFGFEMSGVYRWKNGAVYEGRWQNGKRHGVGVEYNGKWVYKGEWSQGFKGRYGVKASSNSAVKYEGTWANGLQDGYGCETYSDGGFYQGQMHRGLRHGYGVRKSAPYGDSQLNQPARLLGAPQLVQSLSLQSSGAGSLDLDEDSPRPEDGFKPGAERSMASKNGFVLVARPLEPAGPAPGGPAHSGQHQPQPHSGPGQAQASRRSSLTGRLAAGLPVGPAAGLLRRLRKQRSTSDLQDSLGRQQQQQQHSRQPADRWTDRQERGEPSPALPFSLSPEELDITDPSTVETYTGEWKQDKRNGHGVCERSDGLRYEGQWHNDMKCGFGQTTFKDGTKQEGRYKNNILIADSRLRRLFQLAGASARQRIDEAVKMAQRAQQMALQKADIAETRAATARDKADQATVAAMEADRDSQIAFSVARQYSDSQLQHQQHQQQLQLLAGLQQQPLGPPLPGLQAPMDAVGAFAAPMAFPAFQPYRAFPGPQEAGGAEPPVRLEPFNGRRGSFRGSGSPVRPQHQPAGPQRPQNSDPFSDLFDHYRSSNAAAPSLGQQSRRRQLARQTSLDQQRPSAGQLGALGRLRMSSLDQAPAGLRQDQNQSPELTASMQQQLRHLVTSGEQLAEHQLPANPNNNNSNNTPAGSSYILPPSAGSSPYAATTNNQAPNHNHSNSNNNQPGTNLTPSPDNSWTPSRASQAAVPLGVSFVRHNPILGELGHQQRDVQSLADEQLYLSGVRRIQEFQQDQSELRTDYTNYDFAITSSPRPSSRCMRRTASLSRHTLTGAHQLKDAPNQLAWAPKHRQRSASPAVSLANTGSAVWMQSAEAQNQKQPFQLTVTPPINAANLTEPNSIASHQTTAPSNSSHLTLDGGSSVSSAGALMRKPSLQVRYDPVQLGGLMSREEVAALSHAQREQKRQMAELAEKRAKRPLLHLYLSIKEFLVNQRLILAVLVLNVFLFKIFADLIVQN